MGYNIDFDLAGILFLSVFYIFLRGQYLRQDRSNQIFRRMIFTGMLTGILEIVGCLLVVRAAEIPIALIYLVKPIYYLSIVASIILFGIYVRSLIFPNEKWKKIDLIQNILCVAYGLLGVSNPMTRLLFYVDDQRIYRYGVLHPIVIGFPIFLEICVLVRIILHRDKLSKRQMNSLISFILISIIGSLVQHLLLPTIYLAYFSIMLGMVFLLFALEAPTYEELVKITEELQISKQKLQEVTEKKSESSRVMNELLKTANWILEMDENGIPTNAEWGPEFREMMGVENSEQPDYLLWGDLLHPEDKERAMNAFTEGMQEGKSYDIIYRLKDRTGEYRYYRGTGETVKNDKGQIETYQGIIQDVHEEELTKRLTNEKLKAMEELEKSEEALKKALEDAEQANKAKSQFLSNMSHDIRTPMNAVIGFTDLALDAECEPEQVRYYLEKIKASGKHLLLLINDILDMSKIESGKIVIEKVPCDLKAIVGNVGEILRSQAVIKGQQFEIHMEGIRNSYVLCDQLRLNQIILNCVGNSIKFTPDGGRISILVEELKGDSEKEGIYRFIMTDNGIGMSEEFLKKVFDPFERDSSSKVGKIQGSGLGMSIAKNLVELMGGEIRIESMEGHGTTYYVTLPMTILEQESMPEGNMAQGMASKEEMLAYINGKNVLLVDDNKINRLIAEQVLEKFGLNLTEATNGQEAVDAVVNAEPGTFDLVLMDIQMPVLDGYEATDCLRNSDLEWVAKIPVIAMTADAFEEDKEKCKEHKMNGHIAKPFNWDDAIREIYETLQKA